MSATGAHISLPSSLNLRSLLGKLEVTSKDVLTFSAVVLVSQIFWFSIGLSLIYDLTERTWHWPHLAVIGCYGAMLVASTWLSHKAVKVCSTLTLLVIVSTILYAGSSCAPKLSFMQELVEILNSRRIEYTSWFFVMGCSFLARINIKWQLREREFELGLTLAVACFIIGCLIGILPQALSQYFAGDNVESILSSQGLTLVWLAYWAMPSRCNAKANEGYVNRTILKYVKLPKSTLILVMGVMSYVLYDWVCQYLATWLQIIWFFSPVLIYFYIHKRKNRVAISQ